MTNRKINRLTIALVVVSASSVVGVSLGTWASSVFAQGAQASKKDDQQKHPNQSAFEQRVQLMEVKLETVSLKGGTVKVQKAIESLFLGGKLIQAGVAQEDSNKIGGMPKGTTAILVSGGKHFYLSKTNNPKRTLYVTDASGKSIDASSIVQFTDIPSDETRISLLLQALDPTADLKSSQLKVTLLHTQPFEQTCSNCWTSSWCKFNCSNQRWYCDWWDGCETYD